MVPAFWQPEHLHVMLNHLPVTLSLLLAPILAAGLTARSHAVLVVAFSLGILADISTPFVMQTVNEAAAFVHIGANGAGREVRILLSTGNEGLAGTLYSRGKEIDIGGSGGPTCPQRPPQHPQARSSGYCNQ